MDGGDCLFNFKILQIILMILFMQATDDIITSQLCNINVDKFIVMVFIISDDNLISCCLSRLICIDEFTYRSIFGKVFAKYFLKIVVHENKHIPQRCLFYFCPKLPIFDVIFEK